MSALPNTTAKFSIASSTDTGSVVTYQWQSAVSDSSSFINIAGATNASYTTGLLALSDNGNQYRVVLKSTGANDVVSKVATLTVSNLIITSQPTNVTADVSSTITFGVEAATNTGSVITYQWQSAVSGSSRFINIAGATNASYTTPIISLSDNGNQYQVVVSAAGSTPVTSSVATLTIVTPVRISITTQPTNVLATMLSPIFSVVATTNIGTLSYQWQSAPIGSTTFTNIVGATSSSYTIPTILSIDLNTQYQVVVTASSTSITSNKPSFIAGCTIYSYHRWYRGRWFCRRYRRRSKYRYIAV